MERRFSKELLLVLMILLQDGVAVGFRSRRSIEECTGKETTKTVASGVPDGTELLDMKKYAYLGSFKSSSIIEYKYNSKDFDTNSDNNNSGAGFRCTNPGFTDERKYVCIDNDGKIEIREGSNFANVPNTTEIFIKVRIKTLSVTDEDCSFTFVVGFRPTISPITRAVTTEVVTTEVVTTEVVTTEATTKAVTTSPETNVIETVVPSTRAKTSFKPRTFTKIKRTTVDPCAAPDMLQENLQRCAPNHRKLQRSRPENNSSFVYNLSSTFTKRIWKVSNVVLQKKHKILDTNDHIKVSLYGVINAKPKWLKDIQVRLMYGNSTSVPLDSFVPEGASAIIIQLYRMQEVVSIEENMIETYIATYDFCSNASCFVHYRNWMKNFRRCRSTGNSNLVMEFQTCFAVCPSVTSFVASLNATFAWPITRSDHSVVLPCGTFNGNVTRKCSKHRNKPAQWGPVDTKGCMTWGQRRSDDLNQLSKGKISARNASVASQKVKNITAVEPESLHAAELEQVTDLLEELTVFAADEKVANDILDIVDNCMEASDNQLLAGQQEKNVSKRMLTVLSNVCGVMLKNKSRFTVTKKGFALGGALESKSLFQGVTVSYEASKQSNNTGVLSMERGSGRSKSDAGAAIQLPKNLLSLQQREKNELIFIAYEHGKLFQERRVSRLNSRVISAEVRNTSITGLPEPVVTYFTMRNHTALNGTVCAWWDFNYFGGQGGWSTAGCRLHSAAKGLAECHCDHLTNFAVLLGAKAPKEDTVDQIALTLISYIGVGLSLAGSLFTLISYVIFPKLRDNNTPKILMNLCSALIFLQIVFLIGIERTSPREGCQAVAFILQYILLCVLSWSGVEGFFSYRGIVMPMKSAVPDFMLKASMFGWVVPLLFPIIGISVWASEYGDERSCAVKGMPLYTTVVAPVGAVMLLNVFSIVSIMLALNKSSKAYPDNAIQAVHRLRIIAAFVLLFSLTWLFGFFVIANDIVAFQYIFCILNSLQGFFVFVFYGLRNENVRKHWREKFTAYRERKATTSTSAGTKRTESSFDSVTYIKTDSLRSDSMRKNGSLDSQFRVNLTARSNLYSPPP